MPVTYDLDTSGVNPRNLVENEMHSVNEAQFRDYYFLIPKLAPFFIDNFVLKLITGTDERDLVEDVDYSFCLPYVTGTRTTGKQMYGGVTLHNLSINGILSMRYQTVGGDQVVDRLQVLTHLADKAYNPRTTIWDIVTNVPSAFPPVPHYQDYDNFKGQEDVILKLSEIRDAILANSSLTKGVIDEFLTEFVDGSSVAYIRRSGDAMHGPLVLFGPPVEPQHAATKEFVEKTTINMTTFTGALSNYVTNAIMMENMKEKLSLTGGIMTGPIKLTNDPVVGEDAVRKAYMDGVISGVNSTISAMQTTLNNLTSTSATLEYVNDKINQVLARIDMVGMQ